MDPAISQQHDLVIRAQTIEVIHFIHLFFVVVFFNFLNTVSLKKDLSSDEYDASFDAVIDLFRNSYMEALDKVNHQEICFERAKAEIPLLKLDIGESIKREEEIEKRFLQAKQEFREFRKNFIEKIQMLDKKLDEYQPKWLKDEQQAEDQIKTNSGMEKVLAESDQVQTILPPVNKVTSADIEEDKEAIQKLQVHLNYVPNDKLTEYVDDSNAHFDEGTTSEVYIYFSLFLQLYLPHSN